MAESVSSLVRLGSLAIAIESTVSGYAARRSADSFRNSCDVERYGIAGDSRWWQARGP